MDIEPCNIADHETTNRTLFPCTPGDERLETTAVFCNSYTLLGGSYTFTILNPLEVDCQ